MANLIALHNIAHRNLRICPEKVETHGANLSMVPVMLSEFLKLVVQFPIALSKNKDTGQFVCVAMFGFAEGENLFCQNNQCDTLYTPLQIARQPFFLGQDEQIQNKTNSDQYQVCFDPDSNCLQKVDSPEKGSEALFDEEGNVTPYLQRMQSILAELLDGESKTQAFVDKLLTMKLLQAMRLEISFDNGESQRINGMYTIDEEKLNALPGESILELHQLGYLPYIYAMIASMGQIYSLVQRKNSRLATEQSANLKSVSI